MTKKSRIKNNCDERKGYVLDSDVEIIKGCGDVNEGYILKLV